MKLIQLQPCIPPDKLSPYQFDKLHRLYIGNQRYIIATSKRDALFVVAEANRMLNDTLFSASTLYGNLFAEYRNFWFFSAKYAAESRMIQRSFNYIDHTFDTIYRINRNENYNSLVFSKLIGLLNELISVAKELADVHRHRKNYIKVKELDFIKNQLQFLLHVVENYGTLKNQAHPSAAQF